MSQLELDFGVSALADYDEDGFLQIQTDSPGLDDAAGTHPATALTPFGLIGRPLDPDKGSGNNIGAGAGVMLAMMGDQRFALAFNDLRDVALVPQVKKGGSMLFGGAGLYRSFAIFDGLDPSGTNTSGSFSLMVPYARNGAKAALSFAMNVRTPGREAFTWTHGMGHRFELNPDGGIVATSPDAGTYTEVSNGGFVIGGAAKVLGGMTVGQTAAAQPVALAPAVIAAIQLISDAVQAVAAAASLAPGASGATAAAQVLDGLGSIIDEMKAMNLSTS